MTPDPIILAVSVAGMIAGIILKCPFPPTSTLAHIWVEQRLKGLLK